jgi:hypothetical protein
MFIGINCKNQIVYKILFEAALWSLCVYLGKEPEDSIAKIAECR